MEVAVAASMIAVVMVGMSTILINYASSRNKINGLNAARNICLSEIDDVLLHNQIENSLVSDTQGRSRSVLLIGLGLTVSSYYYCNFPINADHDLPGEIWTPESFATLANSRFSANALYARGGVVVFEPGMSEVTWQDPRVEYVVRRQLFGISGYVTDIEQHINGIVGEPRKYVDGITRNSYLIADTCENNSGAAWPAFGTTNVKSSDATYNSYDQKIYVVKVYDKKTFSTHRDGTPQDPPRFYDEKAQRAKTELTQSYTVINGKIRL